MFCTDIPSPILLIFSSATPSILYYSHIPAIIIPLLFGFFVYFKNRNLLASKILLTLSIVFSAWSFVDLILWTNTNSQLIMFFWSFINLLEIFVSILTLYFIYVFLEKKDVSFVFKIIVGLLLLPFLMLLYSKLNLPSFDLINCEPNQGPLIYYFRFLEGVFSVWIISYLAYKLKKEKSENRSSIFYLSLGTVFFNVLISWVNIYGTITGKWEITQYSFFAMPIFIGLMAYLIVRFKAFDIKLIGAQALVVALIVLIGSLLFVGDINTARVIASITLALVGAIGIFLIRSVKKEVQQREALEIANKEIKKKSDELGVANEKLKQLDRAKTDFINFASHQLRTPITSIKGFSSLLTEGSYGELAPEQKEAVKKIEIVTGRMASLVEDFLSASRIDSGTMKYEFEKCKIEDICQEVATTLFPKANSNKLYLKYEKPIAAMPELLIDGSKTRETISNLVDNAIKYTKEGGVTMSLELAENQQLKTNDKRVVRIIVSDTGIGIPKEELAHLFAKFSRGLDIKRLTATGTGLGLFVGKSMIEKQGGKVWAESEGEGKGSRFIVELPVQQSKEILAQ